MRTPSTSSVLRLLDGLLAVARVLLVIVTALFLVVGILAIFDTATTTLSGTTEAVAIEHTTPDGRVATHHPASNTTEWDAGPGTEDLAEFGAVAVTIEIDDRPIRTVAILVIAAWLGLGWTAVTSVRGITRSALDGSTFTAENTRRLRRTGFAALGYAAMLVGLPVLMDALLSRLTLPVEDFRFDGGGGDAWLWLLIGLLIIAIAGAFERGVQLQELEETTI